MQTSFQLVSSKKSASDTPTSIADEYNRGIFQARTSRTDEDGLCTHDAYKYD
jgi:hypothetical protein